MEFMAAFYLCSLLIVDCFVGVLTRSVYLVHNTFHQHKSLCWVTEKTMKHPNQYPEVKNAKLNARGEACLDVALAVAIGLGLATLLFFGLSA